MIFDLYQLFINSLFPAATKQTVTKQIQAKIMNYGYNFDAQVWTYFYAKVRENLIAEEGYRLDVYKDSRGFLTVGIGHLVTPLDNLKIGDKITAARAEQFYQKDTKKAIEAAKLQAYELKINDINFLIALVSVNFQLGTGWRTKFPNTWTQMKKGNWQAVINNLKTSLWAQQTPVRVNNFINAIQEIA